MVITIIAITGIGVGTTAIIIMAITIITAIITTVTTITVTITTNDERPADSRRPAYHPGLIAPASGE
jgi:hypothetical protein